MKIVNQKSKQKKRITKAAIAALLFAGIGADTASACSLVAHQFKDTGVVTGRSLDFCQPLKTNMKMYPRGLSFEGVADNTDTHGIKPITWTNKYGYVAITQPEFGSPDMTSEGINEKGLGAHLLMGPTVNSEPALDKNTPVLDTFHLVPYLLGNYASVNSVVEDINAGKFQLHTYPVQLGKGKVNLPAHFKIEDKTGNSAIIEFSENKLTVRVGSQYTVLTNEPSYDEQLENLNRIKSEAEGSNYTIDNLPGGAKAMNRFVRGSFISENLPVDAIEHTKDGDIDHSIPYMFAAARSNMVPFTEGYHCDFSPDAPAEDKWPTQWTSVLDLNADSIYVINENIGNKIWVNLNELDFTSGQPSKEVSIDNPSLVGDVSHQFSAS
jgi:choloylglycine hydrolase